MSQEQPPGRGNAPRTPRALEPLLWLLWLGLGVFFVQNAIASRQEHEPRAAAIYWMIFGVMLLAGLIVWLVRRNRMI